MATNVGTIESRKNYKPQYIQGVYNYPILDNPVWYVKRGYDQIFDTNEKDKIDFDKDFYLPIGYSPSFVDYEGIKINPDKFFGKHSAILGNTGSGKSCIAATIIQSLFKFRFQGDKKLQSANIIIFDTNGEYKKAFIGDDKTKVDIPESMNAFYISSEGLKVPYWFMNYDDFDYLFSTKCINASARF